MRPEVDVRVYVQDLEKHLQLTLLGGGMADPEGAVLLVRGALAGGDRTGRPRWPARRSGWPRPRRATPMWRPPPPTPAG